MEISAESHLAYLISSPADGIYNRELKLSISKEFLMLNSSESGTLQINCFS